MMGPLWDQRDQLPSQPHIVKMSRYWLLFLTGFCTDNCCSSSDHLPICITSSCSVCLHISTGELYSQCVSPMSQLTSRPSAGHPIIHKWAGRHQGHQTTARWVSQWSGWRSGRWLGPAERSTCRPVSAVRRCGQPLWTVERRKLKSWKRHYST